MARKDDYKKFADEVKNRSITRLIHFTSEQNLLTILESGYIHSRLSLREIKHPDEAIQDALVLNDQVRLDRKTDYVNLSIQHPNTKLLNAYKVRNSMQSWCVIELNPSLLFDKGVLYSVGNAASKRAKTIGIDNTFETFRKMFTGPRTDHLRDCYPSDIQAEVLYPKRIETDHIIACTFKDEVDSAKAKAAMGLLNIRAPKLRVDASLFAHKRH